MKCLRDRFSDMMSSVKRQFLILLYIVYTQANQGNTLASENLIAKQRSVRETKHILITKIKIFARIIDFMQLYIY